MIISILTLFPKIYKNILSYSILGRAVKKKLVKFSVIDIRNFATDKRKSVDDKPYGGGVGMLLRLDVVERAIASSKFKVQSSKLREKIVLLDPAAKIFTQVKARQYSKLDHLILICGHYEGIDSRIYHFIDESVSIGEYILTGGEMASAVITEAVTRLIPGVLNKKEATSNECFTIGNYIEDSQYTRPPVYKGLKVPKVLLSGNHEAIALWKKEQSFLRSKKLFK